MKIFNYLKRPVYYGFLFLKKSKIKIHNKFESRVKIVKNNSLEEFYEFLWKHLKTNLITDSKGIFFNTKVKNKNSPMILSQIRVILILSSNKEQLNEKFSQANIIEKLTDYLISMRRSNGLFTFNQASWNLQDEGIASIWAILALIEAYRNTSNYKYLKVATATFDSINKFLYSKETSLLHTANEHIWCLNAASTFANACSNILNYYVSDWVIEAMNDSVELCIEKIADDGHYPYNQIRTGTYILAYHPIVMITLDNCIHSKYLKPEVKNKLIEANKKALEFLIKCFDSDSRIFEPEILQYNQYIITNITSLLALKGKINKENEDVILANLLNYLSKNELFLCKNERNELYNSDLYNVKDVLAIEVLYWLNIYLKPST
jgi:hypothetical protein